MVDYSNERKATHMKRFVDEHMPDYSEKVVHGQKDLDAFEEKANKYGLPKAVLFTSKSDTMPLVKYLSTEFRRKLLLAEVKPTKKNQAIMEKYGVTDLPALIIIPVGSEDTKEETALPIRYDGNKFTKHKLYKFLSKHALKKLVLPKNKQESPKTNTAKVEL